MEDRSELYIDQEADIPADVAERAVAAARAVIDRSGTTLDDCAMAVFLHDGLEQRFSLQYCDDNPDPDAFARFAADEFPDLDLDEMNDLLEIWDEAVGAADDAATAALPDRPPAQGILGIRPR